MRAAGIDLGGTKIELQVFGDDWEVVARKRVPTPQTYDALIAALAGLVTWTDTQAGYQVPLGIGAAGLINPATELALTANLCATGRPLHRDVERAAGREVVFINDCRALALSEAIFGAGKGHHTVMSLILGTGVGGGVAIGGDIHAGPTMTGGEFGHMSAPAHLVEQYGLPIVQCGCGRRGCSETYIAGPGMSRIAETIMGARVSPPDIIAQRATDPLAQRVWEIWCAFTADLLCNLTLAVDPDVIVIGGGLSKIDGVIEALTAATQNAQFGDFAIPAIVLAQGGDASGARGAAYAGFQHQQAQAFDLGTSEHAKGE
ncbi:ROK family protein [Falsihalocynthiibacter arcticus]|uniref:N-acetylglucosamine kinase n=1 Tax=Falsihalocynthiibacter arcticus TaxID=1579316 RepID=A0A126V6G2_9RHOB|nr:ROK family protein [Falsihalocynthiibacter arcticus]AML53289.1 hypothetical protein RC74_20345 [Falsihalocynthiibacter arcticus]